VVDTVGDPLLAEVLRAVRPGGGVAAIGMAGGADLITTVHPFILRGVTLAGIDAASLPTQAERALLWERLASFWPTIAGRFPVTRLRLEEVGDWADRMRRGETTGRGVVIPE
jgi:NADPH:quinone reductase-like Zn-dependent oxidoreductase